jgi:glycosyltransferase involved in cell wall biosynthesis
VKILSVIEAFCHGGAQTVLVDTLLSLPEHQHRVIHFSRANSIAAEPTFVDALRSAGIECIDTHWDSLRDDDLRSNVLGGFRPDVVMFHWWGNDPWLAWVNSPKPDRPAFVCVLHHEGIAAKAGYDRYVLVSRSQLPQVSQVPAERVVVIPNGIDLVRFHDAGDEWDRPIDSEKRPFVVGRLSELREGKILPQWVHTLASYRLDNTHFTIAGDGKLLPTLREAAIDFNLMDRISFPGYVPRSEVPSLLKTFDVFCYVTSSAVECCPLAILEAMAAGLPVVAEARGGIPEIVVNGENGLLANTLDEIGNHLRHLQDDHALRRRLGRGARATAENFSLKNQISAYRTLLASLQRRGAS